MKKLLVVMFIMLFPMVANAEKCTTEKLNSYIPFVDQVVITPKKLGDSDTYEIWADNVGNGIAVEKGRTVMDSGFLGYATAGQDVIINANVADGGVCAGTNIKQIVVKLPEATQGISQPVVEQPINNETIQISDNSADVDPPVVNQNTTNVEAPSVDNEDTSSTNTNKENDNKATDSIDESSNSLLDTESDETKTEVIVANKENSNTKKR